MTEQKLEKYSNDVSLDFKSGLAPNISETFDVMIDDYPNSTEISQEEETILQKAIENLGKWIIQSYKDHKKQYIEFDGE
jgi:hypothetical protein